MLIEDWLLITVCAAFLQNARSLLQRRLTGTLSVNGASYVRFLYALPFAWLYAMWLWQGEPTGFNSEFFLYITLGAIAQILATSALVAAVSSGNFAVGTAFSKTEAAQAAMVGLVLLGEGVGPWVVIGIFVSLFGVVLLAGEINWRQLLRSGGLGADPRLQRGLWLGLLAGAGFGLSAVGFRGASLALDAGDYLQRAGLAVMVSVTLQTLLMGGYLLAREPGELSRVVGEWRAAIWVGMIGMAASVGWFTAMTLNNAAVVRAVGQIELLFTMFTSVFFFKERLRRREIFGIGLVVLGIWLLI